MRKTCGLALLVAAVVALSAASCAATGTAAGPDRPADVSAGADTTPSSLSRTDTDVTTIRIDVTDPEVGELRFDALAAGDPTVARDGKLVLLLHGFPETGDAYRDILPVLANAGYYAVAPNQRGYSPGARPAAVDAYGVGHLTRDVLSMATELGASQFHLVGHDWGGGVAWVTAGAEPQRVRTLMVLSTPHPDALSDAQRDPAGEQARMSGYMQVFRQPGSEHGMLQRGRTSFVDLFTASGLPRAKAETYADVLATPEALGAALNWYRANPLPSEARMGSVRVPTVFVWGSADGALGRTAAEATAKHVTGPYRFEVLDGHGHWLPETSTLDVTSLLLDQLRT